MPRFEVRERTTFDVVDTAQKEVDPLAKFYEDGVIVLNTGDREEAERVAKEHEDHFNDND